MVLPSQKIRTAISPVFRRRVVVPFGVANHLCLQDMTGGRNVQLPVVLMVFGCKCASGGSGTNRTCM